MKEIVDNYIELITKWVDTAERSSLEIEDPVEYEDMQGRIITIKHHLYTAKLIRNAVVEAEQG